jgi:hypothetical protein
VADRSEAFLGLDEFDYKHDPQRTRKDTKKTTLGVISRIASLNEEKVS